MRAAERGARLEGERRVLQVSDVLRAVEDQFRIAFPRRIWVLGTVRALSGEQRQQFVLTEDVEDAPPYTLPCLLEENAFEDIDASLRRLHDVAVDDLLVEGHFIRAGGLLSYDTERHTLVFSITALDPQPTASWLEERREAVREAAATAGLIDRQRDVAVPLAPRDIGIVASVSEPVLEEVRSTLEGSGFALTVRPYAVRESGAQAIDGFANAIREASLAGHDVILLVREAGRPLALATFDAESVVRAVAAAPVPVLSGLGAPDGPAAVEDVAHEVYPTAHDAADAVLRKLKRAAEQVDETLIGVRDASDEALRRVARQVEAQRHRVMEVVREARERAERSKRRRILTIRIIAAVLALAIIAVAVPTKLWVLLAALVVPIALALFADRLRPRRRRSSVSVPGLTFAAALQRLQQIQLDLNDVTDPDDVLRLEEDAAMLADHCRDLLRRPRALSDRLSGRSILDSDGPFTRRPTQPASASAPAATADDEDEKTQTFPTVGFGPSADDVRQESQAAEDRAPERIILFDQEAGDMEDSEPQDGPTQPTRRTVVLPGDAPAESSGESEETDAPTIAMTRRKPTS